MVTAASENEALLNAFRSAVGDENVVTDAATRLRYETTTYRTSYKVPAIVLPASTEEVQACVRIANEFKTPIYPVSTGLNYGYGSRVPTADNCIIVELSRMKRILGFSEDLGYVTIEPGVTQQQLYGFLQEKKSKLWMDATGNTQGHSLIGNLAERGFGHTPYGDHFGNVGGMEVVLPNGDVIHTGLGRFANAKAKGVYRWGLGPYIDGLFTQSNLGIITQATVWLMPAPAHHEYFYFSFRDHGQIGEIIDLLRPLRLNGTIKSAIHIANDYKVVSSMQGYPWEKASGRTPIPPEVMDELAKGWDCGAWSGYAALTGTWLEVASARRAIKRRLRGKAKRVAFMNPWLIRAAELVKQPYRLLTGVNLPEMLKALKPIYSLTKGVPTDHFMGSTYWRKKDGVPAQADPDRDGCGLLWCAPIAPIDGHHAKAIYDIVLPVFVRHGFEPAVAITLLTERALSCVISIAFDRAVPGEDERALECHDQLLAELTASGYYPYRLSTHAMDKLPPPEPAYAGLLKNLKDALDPNGILAPGRYLR